MSIPLINEINAVNQRTKMEKGMDVPGTAARNGTSAAHGAGGKDMGKKIKCPKCGSLNFEAVATSKKSPSLGKGIAPRARAKLHSAPNKGDRHDRAQHQSLAGCEQGARRASA